MINVQEMMRKFEATTNDCFLTAITQDISEFDTELEKVLEDFYANKDPICGRMATMFNSIFTHQTTTFMYTYEGFESLLKLDENNRYKSVKTKENELMRYFMLNSGMFECLRQPVGRKSGVYKLTHKGIVEALAKKIGQDFLDSKEQKVLEYFDNKGKKKTRESKRLVDMMDDPDFLEQVRMETNER